MGVRKVTEQQPGKQQSVKIEKGPRGSKENSLKSTKTPKSSKSQKSPKPPKKEKPLKLPKPPKPPKSPKTSTTNDETLHTKCLTRPRAYMRRLGVRVWPTGNSLRPIEEEEEDQPFDWAREDLLSQSKAYLRSIAHLGAVTVVGDLTGRTEGPELDEFEATAQGLRQARPSTALRLSDMHPLMPAEVKAIFYNEEPEELKAEGADERSRSLSTKKKSRRFARIVLALRHSKKKGEGQPARIRHDSRTALGLWQDAFSDDQLRHSTQGLLRKTGIDLATLELLDRLRLRRLFAEMRAEMARLGPPGPLSVRGPYVQAVHYWQEQMKQADRLKPITEADLEAVRRWDEAEPARREQAERELAARKQEKEEQRQRLQEARENQPQHQQPRKKGKKSKVSSA